MVNFPDEIGPLKAGPSLSVFPNRTYLPVFKRFILKATFRPDSCIIKLWKPETVDLENGLEMLFETEPHK